MQLLGSILLPALAMGGLSLFFGVLLAVASNIFALPRDEQLEEIRSCLPGANCGGCGFAGCDEFAKAVNSGQASLGKCAGVDSAAKKAIEKRLKNVESPAEQCKAFVCCTAKEGLTKKKYRYEGVADCFAASLLGGGENECYYGCVGFGSCLKKCPFGALSLQNGIAVVDRAKCVGCGACLAACPKGLIVLLPEKSTHAVACASCDKRIVTKNACRVGCIGCGICQKCCPVEAIRVENGLALIDAQKCTSCGLCAKKCPRGIIQLMQ